MYYIGKKTKRIAKKDGYTTFIFNLVRCDCTFVQLRILDMDRGNKLRFSLSWTYD